jgi:hypothetical protein
MCCPIQTRARWYKIQTPASRSLTRLHRGHLNTWETLAFDCCQMCLKNNLVLGSHCTFEWKAVGWTRWMESAWRCSFSWTPSRLGADYTTVNFRCVRSAIRPRIDCNPIPNTCLEPAYNNSCGSQVESDEARRHLYFHWSVNIAGKPYFQRPLFQTNI